MFPKLCFAKKTPKIINSYTQTHNRTRRGANIKTTWSEADLRIVYTFMFFCMCSCCRVSSMCVSRENNATRFCNRVVQSIAQNVVMIFCARNMQKDP